jgi:hypothetical protein
MAFLFVFFGEGGDPMIDFSNASFFLSYSCCSAEVTPLTDMQF